MSAVASSVVRRTDRETVQRAVAVICERGAPAGSQASRFSVGSGYLIGGRRVLTAAHVVEGANADRTVVRLVSGTEHPARPASVGPAADLALLEVTDPAFGPGPPPVAFGRVDRHTDDLIERCSAVGFPSFKQKRGFGTPRSARPLRDTAHVWGVITPRANLVSERLELQVTATPRPLPPGSLGGSEWQGISGAAVCVHHPHLASVILGVVVEHHRPEGSSSLTVVPITAVADREDWRSHLGIHGEDTLPTLPAPRTIEPSPYWATVGELARRTPVLVGREEWLEYLDRFVHAQGSYLWLAGHRWTGKTALTTHFALNLAADVDGVTYFLTPNGDADSARFARVVNDQLARLIGEDPSAATGDVDAFRMRWARAAERAEQERRHLVLIVDGLDEDTSARRHLASVASVLPRLNGGWTHVVVTTGPARTLPADVDVGHPLYDAPLVELPPPNEAVRQRNRDVERRHRLCPQCKQNDEAELVSSAVQKLGGSSGQPAPVGSPAAALQLPHTDQSYLVGWAIRATVVGGVFLLMGGCTGMAGSSSDLGADTQNAAAGLGAFWILLGLAIALPLWFVFASRSNFRARAQRIWETLHYCHRDQLVYQAETGAWCYPGQLKSFLRLAMEGRAQAFQTIDPIGAQYPGSVSSWPAGPGGGR